MFGYLRSQCLLFAVIIEAYAELVGDLVSRVSNDMDGKAVVTSLFCVSLQASEQSG